MLLPIDIAQAVTKLRTAGRSFSAIASEFNKLGLPGPHGGRWYGATVHRLLHGVPGAGQHRCTARCRLQERPCSHAEPITIRRHPCSD